MSVIKLDGMHFKDEAGRTLMLRGVNLGGSSKVPCKPDGSTWNREGFYDHRRVSFIGRPFPLEQADEHFTRLRSWGFTLLRFLVTWEAIEHAGPGIYDQDYLDYLRAIILKAAEYGIRVFIDPHQDVWSRFTGGDGAPGWTLEAVGFDLPNLHASGAAILHQEYGDPFPRMIWPTNHNKLAAATMFTLFFGGNDFAPHCEVGGAPAQEYLQSHYIKAVRQLALKLEDLPNVIGYDTLNEPSAGFIGQRDLNRPASATELLRGDTPTIFQAMLLGSGYPQKVQTYDLGLTGFRKTGKRLVNPEGARAWLPGREDIWAQEGVWGLNSGKRPIILKADHFRRVNRREVNFHADYFRPFASRFARQIREVASQAIIFVEGLPSEGGLRWEAADAPEIVHAAHWYDHLTVFRKQYSPWLGVDGDRKKLILGTGRVRRSFREQIARLVRNSDVRMNHAPTLVGEVGIPFDMQQGRAYRNGDFSMQVRALDASMRALESNFASFTLWNYTADNSNARGDQWNGEDLSLFSRDQMLGTGSIDDGGRALRAALRPYPSRIAGEPLHLNFDIRSRVFDFTFRHDAAVKEPTELYIPLYQYPRGCRVEISDGSYDFQAALQRLFYRHTLDRDVHTIRIHPG
jgi:hypothetical protein